MSAVDRLTVFLPTPGGGFQAYTVSGKSLERLVELERRRHGAPPPITKTNRKDPA